jgi:hypothetical protein
MMRMRYQFLVKPQSVNNKLKSVPEKTTTDNKMSNLCTVPAPRQRSLNKPKCFVPKMTLTDNNQSDLCTAPAPTQCILPNTEPILKIRETHMPTLKERTRRMRGRGRLPNLPIQFTGTFQERYQACRQALAGILETLELTPEDLTRLAVPPLLSIEPGYLKIIGWQPRPKVILHRKLMLQLFRLLRGGPDGKVQASRLEGPSA